jgi:DNA-binding CsgD family transcriptional regulator
VPSELNKFLLDLYHLTGKAPSLEFSRTALELLEQTLPFDSGLWGTFTRTPAGPRPHWVYLHRQPGQMLEEYEHVKQHDLVNKEAIADCGRTVNIDLARVEKAAHPAVVAHVRRWGMEHTLATMLLESPLNLYTAVCLYRSEPKRRFSEPERRFKQAIMPHLVQAWHMNAIHFLDAPPGPARGVPRARALIDRFGVLHNAEPGLTALFRREVPGWKGPNIPLPLLSVIDTGAKEYKGEALIVSLLRQLPDGTFVIGVRARARVDGLSRRELAVAREFASGKTYKEIARLLGTSPATVRTQIQVVYTKLGVRTKVELITQVEYTA